LLQLPGVIHKGYTEGEGVRPNVDISGEGRGVDFYCIFASDVNKDWTCKDKDKNKDKNQAYKDHGKD